LAISRVNCWLPTTSTINCAGCTFIDPLSPNRPASLAITPMSPPSAPMQIDITSVHVALISFNVCLGAYVTYWALVRRERPTSVRAINDLCAIWLSYDAAIHAIVVALGMASPIPSLIAAAPAAAEHPIRVALVWQNFVKPDQALLPATMVGQLAVSLAGPIAGYAALMWWRSTTRWREGEMVAAGLELYASIVGFLRFKPERLVSMSAAQRDAAFRNWAAFFFFNVLWIVIPALLLWNNFKALQLEDDEAVGMDDQVSDGGALIDEKKDFDVVSETRRQRS